MFKDGVVRLLVFRLDLPQVETQCDGDGDGSEASRPGRCKGEAVIVEAEAMEEDKDGQKCLIEERKREEGSDCEYRELICI